MPRKQVAQLCARSRSPQYANKHAVGDMGHCPSDTLPAVTERAVSAVSPWGNVQILSPTFIGKLDESATRTNTEVRKEKGRLQLCF